MHKAAPQRPSKKFRPKAQQSSQPLDLQQTVPVQKQALPFDEPGSSNGAPGKPTMKD